MPTGIAVALCLLLTGAAAAAAAPTAAKPEAVAGSDAGSAAGANDDYNSLSFFWATPVLRRQLLPEDQGESGPNSILRDLILKDFKHFKREKAHRHLAPAALNDAFYRAQLAQFTSAGRLWGSLADSPIVVQLIEAIGVLATRMLGVAASPGQTVPQEHQIFLWAGVHESCTVHEAHTHQGASISGTYYVNIPEGSGELVLEDPRGPLPPFQNKMRVAPRAGLVIMFPSWLSHHVTASCGVSTGSPRIALSFNVIGKWVQTADASAQMLAFGDSASTPPAQAPESEL